MFQKINKQYRLLYSTISFILILIITSCKQVKANRFQNNVVLTDSISTKSLSNKKQPFSFEINNTIPNETFAPLYYEGQLAHWIRRIFQDNKGNLWFGTNHYGALRFDGKNLDYITEDNGINIGRINEIVEDKDGNIWFATDGFGIYKYDGEIFTNFSEKEGLLNNSVWSITIDKNGLFWIGTLEGVSQFNGETFTSFSIPKANIKNVEPILSHNRITNILEDKKGNIWFGTDGYGISKYDGKNFSHLTTKEGLCDNTIYDLMEDSKGNIWIGTMHGGISKFNGNAFINYTKDGIIEGFEVGGFYEDKHANIWFAAEHNGVYRYNGKSFTSFNTENGPDTNGILSILQDRENRFWFGGWKGLFRYTKKGFIPVTKKGPWDE